MKKPSLTPKQALFVAEYLIDCNGTRAAIAAGFSVASAATQGARLLKKPAIADLITERQAQRARRLEVTAERVTEELAKLAFYDVRQLFDDNGRLKEITELDDISAAAIAGIDIAEEKRDKDTGVQSWTKRIKLADRRGALELLGKKLKLWTDRVEHDGKVSIDDKLSDEERALRIGALLNAARQRKNAA